MKYIQRKIRPWKIGETAKELENVFSSQKIAHVVLGVKDCQKFDLFYTPVTHRLYENAQKLGELLHCKRKYVPDDNLYWKKTRNFLEQIYRDAWMSCRGTLVVPPLYDRNTRQAHPFKIEQYSQDFTEWVKSVLSDKTEIFINIEYLDLPPPDWRCDL